MSEDSNSGLGVTNNDYWTTTLKLHFGIIWHRAGSISRLEVKCSLSIVCRFQLFRRWFLSEITWLSIILLSHLHLGIDQVESRIYVALLKLLCASFLFVLTLWFCFVGCLCCLGCLQGINSSHGEWRYHNVCTFLLLGSWISYSSVFQLPFLYVNIVTLL